MDAMMTDVSVSTPGLESLSWSRLEAYRGCSLAFFYKYVSREPPAFVPGALAFGIAFHQAVEDRLVALMAGEERTAETLVEVIRRSLLEQAQERPIRYPKDKDLDSYVQQTRRMLEAWVSWERPAGARILAVEEEIRIPLAEWLPSLVGRVDLVEVNEDEGYLALIDVKTSAKKYSDADLKLREGQLVLYKEGLRDLIDEIGLPVRLGLEVITKTKSPTVQRIYLDEVTQSVDRQIKSATLIVEAVEHGIHIPSPSWQCASCPWAEACREW